MKYDEMMKRFKDNGFDLRRKMFIFYGTFPDCTDFVENKEGIWEKHEYHERERGYVCYTYACEDDAVHEIVNHIYLTSKNRVENAALGWKVRDLDIYMKAMDVFNKGVFKDISPEVYVNKVVKRTYKP